MAEVKAIAWKQAWPARGILENVIGPAPLPPLQVSVKSPMRRADVPHKADILPADDVNGKEDPETEPRPSLGQESGTELLTGRILFAKLCSHWQTLKIGQFEQKPPGPRTGICTSRNNRSPGRRFLSARLAAFHRNVNPAPASSKGQALHLPLSTAVCFSIAWLGSGNSLDLREKHSFPANFASVKCRAQTTNSAAQCEGSRLLYCKGGRVTSAETRAGGNTRQENHVPPIVPETE